MDDFSVFAIDKKKYADKPTAAFAKYYSELGLIGKEKEKRIGFTYPINTRGMPPHIDYEDHQCYAYMLIAKTGRRFFVKMDRINQLFDPWGNMQEGTEMEKDEKTGRYRWEFGEVSEDCFWFYLMFLQSRNEYQLIHAQRNIENAK